MGNPRHPEQGEVVVEGLLTIARALMGRRGKIVRGPSTAACASAQDDVFLNFLPQEIQRRWCRISNIIHIPVKIRAGRSVRAAEKIKPAQNTLGRKTSD